MSKRWYLVLTAVTVLALFGAAWAIWDEGRDYISPTANSGPLFPALAQADAATDGLEVTTPTYKLQLRHAGEAWLDTAHAGYPARGVMASKLIADIAAMHGIEAKTSKPEWYDRIGVEDVAAGGRSARVRVLGGDKALADLLLGKVSSSLGADVRGGTFMRRPGESQAWLATGIVQVAPALGDWFEQLLNIDGSSIAHITINEHGAAMLDVKKLDGSPNYTLQAIDPAYATDKNVVADDALIKRIEQSLVAVSFEDVRKAAGVTPGSRAVRFETSTGMVLQAQLGEADGKPWVSFHADAPSGSPGAALAAAINGRCDGWAFRLASAKMLPLLSNVKDLVHLPEATPPAAGGAGQIFTDPSMFTGTQPPPVSGQ
ncbi:MAG TPA: hypothetical protein VGO70_07065 [Arsenicitalea sp.]|jgi:hypothetical protein|nr:hypothetical protein [Arsenicitalea sp.]